MASQDGENERARIKSGGDYTELDQRNAFLFILLLGVVSLLADMTYEGARSINGQFLESLGASGTVVGLVAGLGELVGYSVRLVSGYLSDNKKNYWILNFIGYSVNLIAVPLLALAGNWPLAAFFMIMERLGKGIRSPSKSAMLSHAGAVVGSGRAFGIHEAMDQVGAITGPLIVIWIYTMRGDYHSSYIVLAIPAILALAVLLVARHEFPHPSDLEKKNLSLQGGDLPKNYWWFVASIGFLAAGFADFPLIGYYLANADSIDAVWIPVFYSIAMGLDAITAIVVGHLYDRIGIKTLQITIFVTAFFAPLVFLSGFYGALLGMILWGIGIGAHEALNGAVIATIVPKDRRGSAYGIFNVLYGLFWFGGSMIIGLLLDLSIPAVVAFSMIVQFISIPLLSKVNSGLH